MLRQWLVVKYTELEKMKKRKKKMMVLTIMIFC